ncbi:protein ZINC INDUCED FACILITATOR-LIKE 1-like protein [Corchorus olitorius]|uniref:Protein ZINC INDUCED FACILITATOR-LIKE 1-like protein n=1 Tax=Corchorus olitorius TaxID=93759 RepID=A0A1R3K4W3_9ROSI|nr:protein ZINC INDUCED FACILITATOR-LIKE 1-like protein [Corchorus olitorius]
MDTTLGTSEYVTILGSSSVHKDPPIQRDESVFRTGKLAWPVTVT